MKTVLVVVGLAVVMAGCVSQQQVAPPQRTMTKCEEVAEILASPYAYSTTKQVAMEVGRNNGCFGQQPVQRVQIVQ